MKGIILAGGKGTRLRPITHSTPKHLLPVYNKPLIFYSLWQLYQAGIREIVVVVNARYLDQFQSILGDGSAYGLKLHYALEDEPLGILYAVSLAHPTIGDSDIVVLFGDNIFEDDIKTPLENYKKQEFSKNGKIVRGARIALKSVSDPERFGICEFDKKGHIISLVEKPEHPKSNLALTGLFFADRRYYSFFKDMEPSARGEYEFPDFLRFYLQEGSLQCDILKGQWFDTGTFDALLEASNFIKDHPTLREKFF